MNPVYLVPLNLGRSSDKSRWAWFEDVYSASVFGSVKALAPINRTEALPDGVEGKDYLITYSNYY